MKIMSSLAVVLLLVAACGKSESETKTVANAERPSCASHADCTMTTFSGCCSCCEAAPKAMLKSELDRQQGRCHGVDCSRECSENIECAKNERLDAFNALCREGTCVSEKKAAQ